LLKEEMGVRFGMEGEEVSEAKRSESEREQERKRDPMSTPPKGNPMLEVRPGGPRAPASQCRRRRDKETGGAGAQDTVQQVETISGI
jgi:hypothetical protein